VRGNQKLIIIANGISKAVESKISSCGIMLSTLALHYSIEARKRLVFQNALWIRNTYVSFSLPEQNQAMNGFQSNWHMIMLLERDRNIFPNHGITECSTLTGFFFTIPRIFIGLILRSGP